MDRSRCLSVCFVGLVLVAEALGQVSTLCRSNERYLSCGCQKTCKDPAPECKGVCKEGCFCEGDQVRNETGHCVELAECPPVAASNMQTSEPRASDIQCQENEEYRYCEPCNRTCENPDPICPAQCARGCFCIEGMLKDKDGKCVPKENCSTNNEKIIVATPIFQMKPLRYQLTCGPHQTYRDCEFCDKTCSHPRPICQARCSAGCFCEDGYVKAPSGQCVRLEECPRAEVTIGGAQEPLIEDCHPDEVFLLCGWCEPSCSSPRPECPVGICTRGCLCRPPLIRHYSGLCVEERNCLKQKCPDPNEEYVCKYGCEARCDSRICLHRLRRCSLGCHCKLGLLRDVTGNCVTPELCLGGPNIKRIDYRRLNESDLLSDTSTLKSFFEVRTYMEIPHPSFMPKTQIDQTGPRSLMEILNSKKGPDYKGVNSELKVSKNFKDIVSMTHGFYKDFVVDTPIYASDIHMPKAFAVDLAIPVNVSEGNTMLSKDLVANNSDEVMPTDSIREGEVQALKENYLNTYLNEIISAMKQMLPQPLNFTIINYPIW